MSQIAVEAVQPGLHPSERLVSIRTADGNLEEVFVDASLVIDMRLVTSTVSATLDRVLVELPRETARGAWRLWVPRGSLAEGHAAAT